MDGSKHWYESRTVWGTLIALVGAVAPTLIQQIGADQTTDDAARIAGGLAAVIGGIVAIYGRYRASKSLTR